jgi:hypothetical protein
LARKEGKRVAEATDLPGFWNSSGRHRVHTLGKARLVKVQASLISNGIPWSEVTQESVAQGHTNPDGSLTAASKELVGPEVKRLISVGYEKRVHSGHFDQPDSLVLMTLKPEYLPPSTIIPTSVPTVTQLRGAHDR